MSSLAVLPLLLHRHITTITISTMTMIAIRAANMPYVVGGKSTAMDSAVMLHPWMPVEGAMLATGTHDDD